MAKSLQEQLLESGAARPKQAKKARREKTRQVKAARQDPATRTKQDSLDHDIAARDAAKRAHDRDLNAAREARREASERDAAAAQLIAQHQIAPDVGDAHAVAYNYTVEGRIKRLTVSDAQRRELAAGRLAIARHRGTTTLVNASVAERLAAIIPDAVWRADPADDTPDPDDPYAAFTVPDDLMW